jgi:nitroimidazol reductase NimA-like FMN-containing flavoprotein (pyridoxamine 5'-phosphate oxidase superfamily)
MSIPTDTIPSHPSESSPPEAASDRTRLRIHPERSAPDELGAILRAGLVAHVGIADALGPVVIPMTYFVDAEAPRSIYVHGAHHSRLMAHTASGAPVCVTVTLVDGLVYSRTALYHSVNYRSAVCFGRARVVSDPAEQLRVSEGLVARYFPARTAGVDYDPIPAEHLTATAIVAIDIVEASAKIRRGGPKGPRDGDADAPGSAGVVSFDPPR